MSTTPNDCYRLASRLAPGRWIELVPWRLEGFKIRSESRPKPQVTRISRCLSLTWPLVGMVRTGLLYCGLLLDGSFNGGGWAGGAGAVRENCGRVAILSLRLRVQQHFTIVQFVANNIVLLLAQHAITRYPLIVKQRQPFSKITLLVLCTYARIMSHALFPWLVSLLQNHYISPALIFRIIDVNRVFEVPSTFCCA